MDLRPAVPSSGDLPGPAARLSRAAARTPWDLTWLAVLTWAGALYLLVNAVLPGLQPPELSLYLVQPLLWSSLALLSLVGWRRGLESRPAAKESVMALAVLIGAFQVVVTAFAGIVGGFGRSPYGHQPLVLAGNFLYWGSMLVGVEVSRAYLMAHFGRQRPLMALVGTSLFFAFVSVPLARLDTLTDAPSLLRLSGDTFLPTLSENLLASYLALVGGPLASLCYRLPLSAFEWSSPILPDLSWPVATFIGTLAPAFGLWAVQENVAREASRGRTDERPSGGGWLLGISLSVAVLWFNLGLFGIRPTLVSGVSMAPALRPGDIVVTREVPAESVEVGNVIRYRLGDSIILHRVVAIEQDGDQVQFITRGDANNVNDLPVPDEAVSGKVILRLPYVGWVSIGMRQLIEWIR